VAAHGIDAFQAGARQWSSNVQVDTATSLVLQGAGMSQRNANIADAGIGFVGSFGAGAANFGVKLAVVRATVPEVRGLGVMRTESLWESGARALPTKVYESLGGVSTHSVQKGLMIEQGVVSSAEMGGTLSNLGIASKLVFTGLTPRGEISLSAAAALANGVTVTKELMP
jgi:hypothetical protein